MNELFEYCNFVFVRACGLSVTGASHQRPTSKCSAHYVRDLRLKVICVGRHGRRKETGSNAMGKGKGRPSLLGKWKQWRQDPPEMNMIN